MVKIETWTKLRKSHSCPILDRIKYLLSISIRIILWVTNNEYSIGLTGHRPKHFDNFIVRIRAKN